MPDSSTRRVMLATWGWRLAGRAPAQGNPVNLRRSDLIQAFEERTGYGIIINTSFNVRGEPIVCTPEDAYRCFMRTEMDYLVLGNQILAKEEQPAMELAQEAWQEEFPLD